MKVELSRKHRARLTKRLLGRALAYKGIILLGFLSMVLAAATQISPVALSKIFVEQVLENEAPPAPPSPQQGWQGEVVAWGRASGRLLGISIEAGQERGAALAFIVLCLLLLTLLGAATCFANEFIAKYLAARVVADLRQAMMSKVLKLPLVWFSRRKMGDLVSRFSTDAQVTFRTVNIFFSELSLQPLILLFGITAACFVNWRLALSSIIFLPLIVLPVRKVGQRVLKRSRRSLVTLGETIEAVNQVLSGHRVVKAFGMQEGEEREFGRINDKWVRHQASVLRARGLNRAIVYAMNGFVGAVVLGVGGAMVINHAWGLTTSSLTQFLVALAVLARPLKRISVAYNAWQESLAAAGRLFEILDHEELAPDVPGALAIGPIKKGLEFRGVSFAYSSAEGSSIPVLKDLSFRVPAGRTVALVGPSGAGKSTVADLIFRLHEPDQGTILIDGLPLGKITRESLVKQLAVVAQQPFLFNTSVRENIAYGRPGATLPEIQQAARSACIHTVIERLPGGYDTVVGERGATLSGGQLQRITIARAILKDASFLLLDEATSSLDAHSERSVQEALKNLMQGRTALVIAHRLSTILDADLILVMSQGRIVEQGRHADLVKQRGAYHRLYELQMAEPAPALPPEPGTC